jgi:molybdenum cofactor synthesis domain-containing protein
MGPRVKALVLTVSDRVSSAERTDVSGPLGAELLTAAGFEVATRVVPDDIEMITSAITDAVGAGSDLVITTGGTGLGPRAVTPEASTAVIERPAPGLADLIRRAGGAVPTAALSRGVAGVAGRTLIVNMAGSAGAVQDGLDALLPLLPHAVDQIRGGDHHDGRGCR